MFFTQYKNCAVFTGDDPRRHAGFEGHVVEDVSLSQSEDINKWPAGSRSPEELLGRSPDDPKHFCVFRSQAECRSAGYVEVPGTATIHESWSDFLQLVANSSPRA